MGEWHGPMAMSGKRGDHVGGRSGHAFAAIARNNTSPLLGNFIGEVRRLADMRAQPKRG